MNANNIVFNTSLLTTGLLAANEYVRGVEGIKNNKNLLTWYPVEAGLPGHEWQIEFLKWNKLLLPYVKDLIGHESFAHIDSKKVNEWFAQFKNIPVRFDEKEIDPDLFYVATYFGLKNLYWQGDVDIREYRIKDKSAFRLGARSCGVTFYNKEANGKNPLVVIPTSNPQIQILAYKYSAYDEFELLSNVQKFRQMTKGRENTTYGGVVLPNVLIEKEVPVGQDKLVNLWTKSYTGHRVKVIDAGMFLRLILCPDGPLAEGAAKMECGFESGFIDGETRPDYVFDESFTFAVVDTRIPTVPYVAAWVSPEGFNKRRIFLDEYR